MNCRVRATTSVGDYVSVLHWDGDGDPDMVRLRRFIVRDMAQRDCQFNLPLFELGTKLQLQSF